jgi:polysaccharide biosynthesis/export protein
MKSFEIARARLSLPRWIRLALSSLLSVFLLVPDGAVASADEYRLGGRDVVEVSVFGQPDLSGKYALRPDGAVAFPLIGEVKAAGLTAGELETQLRDKLADGFLTNPQVTVKLLEFNSQRVFVMGEVGTPGPLSLNGPLTLLEALSRAGGLTKTAGSELVVLRSDKPMPAIGPLLPGQTGVHEVTRIGLDDLEAGLVHDNLVLNDGDTVFAPKAGVVVVTGEVITPGPIAHARNLTVLQAISLAGGTTKVGSDKRARIVRIVDGQKKEIKAKLSDLLQPGDIVRVPPRMF